MTIKPVAAFLYLLHILILILSHNFDYYFQAKEVARTCGSRILVIHENNLLVDTYEGGADFPGPPPGRTNRKRQPFDLPEEIRAKIRMQNPEEDLTSNVTNNPVCSSQRWT